VTAPGAAGSGPTGGARPTARELGQRSMAAVEAGDRDGWLALFGDDAVVEDPVGPSMFDPEGRGTGGRRPSPPSTTT